MTKGRLFQILFLMLTSFGLKSQDLIINYTEPPTLLVCDNNDFQFTLTNASPNTISNIVITVALPNGIEYVTGSLSNGTEQNISNPSAPVFSFQPIPAFQMVNFSIGTELKCALVDGINNGSLFQNTITATWDGGTNQVTTDPFEIETPLLVITNLTNPVSSGSQGEIITRTLTVQNTRLGALSSITFTDIHAGGISISSPQGTVIASTPNSFELELSGTDFMTIGDGDNLFEFNEAITITENVLVLDCGFDIPSSGSIYTVGWRCYGAVCQEDTRNALVDIIPFQGSPVLEFQEFTELPTNYCAGLGATQSLTITNVSADEAYNVELLLQMGDVGGAPSSIQVGMEPNSFVLDSNGVVTAITPTFSSSQGLACVPSPNVFHEATLNWDVIPAGATMILTWDYYYCNENIGCDFGLPFFKYDYFYENFCQSDTTEATRGYSEETLETIVDQYLKDSIYYFYGYPIENDSAYTVNYQLRSNQLDTDGILNLEFTLPCGYSWENNNLLMGGLLPINTNVTNLPSGETIIQVEYDLPMNQDSVSTTFDIGFDCNAACAPVVGCDEIYLTVAGDVECGTPSLLFAKATFREDASIPLECGMIRCDEFELIMDCNLNDLVIADDSIFDIYLFENNFCRWNFDEPDNDDNRLPDASGDLDFNLVRKDRAIPGDTVISTISGVIHFPVAPFPVEIDLMTVQFEAHSADNGVDGGTSLDFGFNGSLMAEDGIQPIDATLKIFDQSAGTYYTCDVGMPLMVDSLHRLLDLVNVNPSVIVDEMLYRQFKYNTALADLAGCLPPGFEYAEGDSILFTTSHRMWYNPKPQIQPFDTPPIVNLRSVIVPDYCDSIIMPYLTLQEQFHAHFQYSGYYFEITQDPFDTEPCEPTDSPGDMKVRFVLGKDNFFPFEYRPLAQLAETTSQLPLGITLLESRLNYLRYQDGSDIFSNENLNFSLSGQTINYDIQNFHDPIIDEGWEMSFYQQFDPDCKEAFFLDMVARASVLLDDGLPDAPIDSVLDVSTSFESAVPNFNVGVTQANFTGFDNLVSWSLIAINGDVTNANIIPAENAWIQPISPSGLINDFQIINLITGQPLPQTNGVFQLGTLNLNDVFQLQMTATNNSCVQEVIQLHFGWNCTAWSNSGDTPCKDETIILTAISPLGEFELDVVSPMGPFDLCEEIDYHTVEIFNAQLGNIFDVVLEAILPPGLSIVPNTSQMAQPANTAFADIDDPVVIGNNLYEWNISEINTTIGLTGLPGVSVSPQNSVNIRFKTNTECGFAAGSQIIFKVKGKQNCDQPSNTLSKASDPINITGITPTYTSDVNVSVNAPPAVSCDASVLLNINILPGGMTMDTDSVLISLPPGVIYVPGSYTPINNAPANEPQVITNFGQQFLKLKLDGGIPALTLISFEIETTGYGVAECADQLVQVLVVQRQDAVCSTTGDQCYVLAETGSASVIISPEHPDFNLQNLQIDPMGNVVGYLLDIFNSGIPSSEEVVIDFYNDTDGDGDLSPGDVLISSTTYIDPIQTNETISLSGFINLPPDQLCNLLVVIDQDRNCICFDEVLPVNFLIQSELDPVAICSGEPIEIGIDSVNNHSYFWNPADDLDCSNCPTTTLQTFSNNMDTVVLQYTLVDQTNTCEAQHTIEVTVYPDIEDQFETLEICAGEMVNLEATPGIAYNWVGAGITNPNLQTQQLTLFENTIFTATTTTLGDCETIREFNVTVLPFQEIFSEMNSCPGETVMIFNELVTTPGMYCDTVSTASGCDSLICIELLNYLSATDETRVLCPGDSITIDGIIYTDDALICNTTTSSFGCDSTHCVTINLEDEPFVEIDSMEAVGNGEEIQLMASPGFANYEWSPSDSLSCLNCANPTVTLFESTTFSVTVTDANGCTAEDALLLTVLAPCDPFRLEIPNVFTPNNDGVNDQFGVVDFEGTEMILSLEIYNRWGQKIFQASGENAKWDGTQNGKAAPTDVYVYILKVICPNGGKRFHGDVTLVR